MELTRDSVEYRAETARDGGVSTAVARPPPALARLGRHASAAPLGVDQAPVGALDRLVAASRSWW